jgi:hypothetical protein
MHRLLSPLWDRVLEYTVHSLALYLGPEMDYSPRFMASSGVTCRKKQKCSEIHQFIRHKTRRCRGTRKI